MSEQSDNFLLLPHGGDPAPAEAEALEEETEEEEVLA